MKIIRITTEYIKLDQFLKLAGVIGSGGEARELITQNKILVNGEAEDRRGRKLRDNDSIWINGEIFKIAGTGEKL